MALALLALGSNLGDRAGTLRRALAEMKGLPGTTLVARSPVHETKPIGGPSGQGQFLNAAAVVQSTLAPVDLLGELRQIEKRLGRQPAAPWAARIIDLDVLLYDDAVLTTPEVMIPHPRMSYRRFVLEPAAEIAGSMVHPESGWTVAALLSHLNYTDEWIALAAPSAELAGQLVIQLAERLQLSLGKASVASTDRPRLISWPDKSASSQQARPKLLLALSSGGSDSFAGRRMLDLPTTGPVAWISDHPAKSLDEAIAAIQSVWPALAN